MHPLATQYLTLAAQLLTAAEDRPEERTRLNRAALVTKRLADLAQNQAAVHTGWLTKAEELITPALTGSIEAAVVSSAEVYADMAALVAQQDRFGDPEVAA